MKNKIKFKKYLLISLLVSCIFVGLFICLEIYEYKTYTINYNFKINGLINVIKEKYPDIKDEEIINILNENNNYFENKQFLKKYGIDFDKSILVENDNYHHKFLMINITYIILIIVILMFIFIKYNKNKDKELKNITKYIEEINKKNYNLYIDSNTEDELSILKNELYKITIMLKESAENSLNDKKILKEYLEDISHQLKTPLTSIYIMLDNIIDDPSMEEEVRNKFINQIKRQVTNINFLVGNLLKLSKFDVNTINFNRKPYLVEELIKETILNITSLCDLKNIKINWHNECQNKIVCDKMWQVEALTNILKNAIEHSNTNGVIEVMARENNVYFEIEIKDYGTGMDAEDLKHIFERFYKGKYSSNESVGIGLALAKTIIEKDNGKIDVNSKLNKGTTFTIKYFK